MLGRIVREPLIHFLLAGAAIFALLSLLGPDEDDRSRDAIVVTQGQIDQMVEIWTRMRLRPPTERELQGLINDYVREEALYREALALDLDRDDTIVRRRLAQKLEFVFEGLASVAEPTDTQLQDLLDTEPDRFSTGGRVSFQQIFVSVDTRGDSAPAFAEELLARLRDSEEARSNAATLGDGTLLEFAHEDLPVDQVDRMFGPGFAASLSKAEPDAWSGPIASAFGLHVVRVVEFLDRERQPLDDVRDAVRQEWLSRERRRLHEEFVRTLIEQYEVVIETAEGTEP